MEIRVLRALDDVAPERWDALAGEHNPFVEHAFLSLLERSGSVGPGTGWEPVHVVVEEAGELVGAAPCYLKDESYGEYIFDWSWAEAAARAGLPYYPKLVVAVPFTPATGPRLLVREDADRDVVRHALVDGLEALMDEVDAQGLHVLFSLDEEAAFLESRGLVRRATHQFHWRNDGYTSFDSFLDTLRSEPRKQIRKERRKVRESGLCLEVRRGDELSPEEWRCLDRLYRSTSGRKWGSPYLTRRFFEEAAGIVGHRAVVAFARSEDEGGKIVAGALSFEKGAHLYGRYWGAFVDVDSLHFEVCYYQLIERAIERGLSLVEAGAQGPHKLKRGFLPVVTHSSHKLKHPALHDAVLRAMRAEAGYVRDEIARAQLEGLFRKDAVPDLPPVAGVPLPMDARE